MTATFRYDPGQHLDELDDLIDAKVIDGQGYPTGYVNETANDLRWTDNPITESEVRSARSKAPVEKPKPSRKVRGTKSSKPGLINQLIAYLRNWKSSPLHWTLITCGLKVAAIAPATPAFVDMLIATLLNPVLAIIIFLLFKYVVKREELIFDFGIAYLAALSLELLFFWKP